MSFTHPSISQNEGKFTSPTFIWYMEVSTLTAGIHASNRGHPTFIPNSNLSLPLLAKANHAFFSEVDCGYDATITPLAYEKAEAALSKLKTTDRELRCYLEPYAVWHTKRRLGHSAFGYIAYGVARTKLDYLKDFRRTDLPGIPKEEEMYRELHDTQVPNTPRMSLAGNAPPSPEHADILSIYTQRARTQD
ncbi:hypothetical protein B0F90DRAFT_1819850 [Multifurca ochricompacta]|uniref:Uncharacterized protein n=1 Tax=Multifurca ochricompacta TaxID=376703 RepID=A0AAD4QIV4_9AGAM|nr:hypothetical protein B0F90DRAFT_1819850 [Multifurca ochricompacta]